MAAEILQHSSIKTIACWQDLLRGCSSLSAFVGHIEVESEKAFRASLDAKMPLEDASKLANKLKGDVFEVFCELLIRLSPMDDRIGIANYHVINPEDDVGVDGYGIARDGRPATVQCKYRRWDWSLNKRDHLDNFRWSSMHRHKVPPDAAGHMVILTTGKDLNWTVASRQFMGLVRCISAEASYGCLWDSKQTVEKLFSLKTIVDGNAFFWDKFRKETL